jgi:hypothetical protein
MGCQRYSASCAALASSYFSQMLGADPVSACHIVAQSKHVDFAEDQRIRPKR